MAANLLCTRCQTLAFPDHEDLEDCRRPEPLSGTQYRQLIDYLPCSDLACMLHKIARIRQQLLIRQDPAVPVYFMLDCSPDPQDPDRKQLADTVFGQFATHQCRAAMSLFVLQVHAAPPLQPSRKRPREDGVASEYLAPKDTYSEKSYGGRGDFLEADDPVVAKWNVNLHPEYCGQAVKVRMIIALAVNGWVCWYVP